VKERSWSVVYHDLMLKGAEELIDVGVEIGMTWLFLAGAYKNGECA